MELPADADVPSMSVKALRALIARCGGDSEDCLEKSEIRARALLWLGRARARARARQEQQVNVNVNYT